MRISDFDSPTTGMVTERVVVGFGGAPPNAETTLVAISSDAAARYVLVRSEASNLVEGDMNRAPDLFLVDRTGGTVTRVSVGADGGEVAWAASDLLAASDLSGDGRFVVFETTQPLRATDTNMVSDIYMVQVR